jgi:hypothetical protein
MSRRVPPSGVSITGLARYGERGWTWTETTHDFGPALYRTSGVGDGLWAWARTTCWHRSAEGTDSVCSAESSCYHCWEWRQVKGTCQYELPNCRQSAYSKIRRALLHEVAS